MPQTYFVRSCLGNKGLGFEPTIDAGQQDHGVEVQKSFFVTGGDATVKTKLRQADKITAAGMFAKLAEAMPKRSHPVFDAIVVDESQDISV